MPENVKEQNQYPEQQEPVMAPVCPGGQLYTVKSGDTMFFIARRFNVSLQSLINANPQIPDPNTIYPGQVICIPGTIPPGVSCPGGQIYKVVGGDTMFEIAKRFGVTLEALINANPQISNPDLIYPGQEICVPMPAGPVPCPGGSLYAVKHGDTMFEIAKMNGISLAALIAANPWITDPNMIFPGQVICVPRPAVTPQPEMPARAPVTMPLPAPMPKPMPSPAPPVVSPIFTYPPRPSMPPAMPCPPSGPMTQPMPVYIVIPWEECPYRRRGKKKERRRKGCR